jgi:hypothetical protein
MKRRTLDLVFSIGGAALAVLLLILGLVLQNQASFAKDYVHDQMAEQKITFTPTQGLSDEEKKADCLVKNAGKPLLTGKQAECYANKYIALHLTEVNDGKTYAESSGESRELASQAEEAAKSDPESAATKELQAKADEANGKVQTLFRGETLRGLLLTSYGFSIFGERAGQAALVSFLAAAVLALATIAGLVHALKTPKDETVHLA